MPDAAGNIKGIAIAGELPWKQTFEVGQMVRVANGGTHGGRTGKVVLVSKLSQDARYPITVRLFDGPVVIFPFAPGELRPI